MSITYNTIAGDTFDGIARKKYGVADGLLISNANPAVSEPIPTGTTVNVPVRQADPKNQTRGTAADNPDEVAITIAGETFKFWTDISITRTVDSMDTFSMGAPTTNRFKPLSFDPVAITVGGVPLFTGTMLGVTPSVNAARRTDEVNGYSLPGVLNDCTMPASAYPINEMIGQTLEQIAEALLKPFGVSVAFTGAVGAVFEQVAIEEGEKVLSFLSGLAKQRKLVIGSSPAGALVFSAPTAGELVAKLAQGQPPLTSVMPMFSPQEYYSDVTGIEPAIVGLPGQTHTVKNTRLTSVVRPYTFIVQDAPEGGLKAAVEAKAARMFAQAAQYTVELATWRNASGGLWAPGDTVQLDAPGAKVFGFYAFLVRSVTFRASPVGRTATLDLVLPSVFSGTIPESMPWDE